MITTTSNCKCVWIKSFTLPISMKIFLNLPRFTTVSLIDLTLEMLDFLHLGSMLLGWSLRISWNFSGNTKTNKGMNGRTSEYVWRYTKNQHAKLPSFWRLQVRWRLSSCCLRYVEHLDNIHEVYQLKLQIIGNCQCFFRQLKSFSIRD